MLFGIAMLGILTHPYKDNDTITNISTNNAILSLFPNSVVSPINLYDFAKDNGFGEAFPAIL